MTDSSMQTEERRAQEPARATGKKKKGRALELVGVLVILGVIVGAAFYQEQITAFFTMRLWDKGAPGRTVANFLTAGKKGDQQTADNSLGSKEFKPLTQNGKWQGYTLPSIAGTMVFTFDELAPNNPPSDVKTEFISVGKPAAEVMMPDAKGTPVKYRLEMIDGSWKITEILGGHPAK